MIKFGEKEGKDWKYRKRRRNFEVRRRKRGREIIEVER